MSDGPLKPWSLAPLLTACLVLFVLFTSGLGILTLLSSPSLKATAATKLLLVILVASGIGGAVSTLMWSRYWRQVQWDVGFWAFVSGPAPEYEDALLAWRWGRRFRLCWIITIIAMGTIVLAERLGGNW